MGSVFGGAALSGIGFTVSLLIIGLAFGGPPTLGRQATVRRARVDDARHVARVAHLQGCRSQVG